MNIKRDVSEFLSNQHESDISYSNAVRVQDKMTKKSPCYVSFDRKTKQDYIAEQNYQRSCVGQTYAQEFLDVSKITKKPRRERINVPSFKNMTSRSHDARDSKRIFQIPQET